MLVTTHRTLVLGRTRGVAKRADHPAVPPETVVHGKGAEVDLPEDLALDLIDRGAATAVEGDAVPGTRSSSEDELDDVALAILELDSDDKSLYTADGLPTVEALSEALGRPITAAERDAGWAQVQD